MQDLSWAPSMIDRSSGGGGGGADGIVFHEEDSTIQLTAGGEPIGERIYVSTSRGKAVSEMEIDPEGNLVVTYDDGAAEKLGRVVGRDGKVYVPHIDEHRVLTFTIEDEAGEVPGPVDMNPNDEWSEMESAGTETDYVWEPMGDGPQS